MYYFGINYMYYKQDTTTHKVTIQHHHKCRDMLFNEKVKTDYDRCILFEFPLDSFQKLLSLKVESVKINEVLPLVFPKGSGLFVCHLISLLFEAPHKHLSTGYRKVR